VAAIVGGLALLACAGAAAGMRHAEQSRNLTIARALLHGDPRKAPALIRRYGCGGCHTISAVQGADGKVAPPLDHLRQRVFIGGTVRNTPDNLMRWIVSPRSLSPDTAMPASGITQAEARDLATFLYAH
jgi:cytochrome c2